MAGSHKRKRRDVIRGRRPREEEIRGKEDDQIKMIRRSDERKEISKRSEEGLPADRVREDDGARRGEAATAGRNDDAPCSGIGGLGVRAVVVSGLLHRHVEPLHRQLRRFLWTHPLP